MKKRLAILVAAVLCAAFVCAGCAWMLPPAFREGFRSAEREAQRRNPVYEEAALPPLPAENQETALTEEETEDFLDEVFPALAAIATDGVEYFVPEDLTADMLMEFLAVYYCENDEERENYDTDGLRYLIPESEALGLVWDVFGQEAMDSLMREEPEGYFGAFDDGYYIYPPIDDVIEAEALHEGGTLPLGEEAAIPFSEKDHGEKRTGMTLYVTLTPDFTSRYGCMVESFRAEYPERKNIGFDENGMVFPQSSEQYLAEDDLLSIDLPAGYTLGEMLGYARNEIYARHGHAFQNPEYAAYYSQFDWYNSLPKKEVTEDDFNSCELANVFLIKSLEARMGE